MASADHNKVRATWRLKVIQLVREAHAANMKLKFTVRISDKFGNRVGGLDDLATDQVEIEEAPTGVGGAYLPFSATLTDADGKKISTTLSEDEL